MLRASCHPIYLDNATWATLCDVAFLLHRSNGGGGGGERLGDLRVFRGGVWKIGEKWIKRWRGEKGFRFKLLGCVLYFCVLLLVHTFFYSYIGPCWDVSPSTHWPSPVPGIGDFKKLLWNMGILCHLLGQIIAWKKSRLVKYENLARSIQLPLKKSRKKLGFSNPLLQTAIVGKLSFSFGSRVWKYHDPWWWGASILGRGNSHPKYMKIHGSTFSTTLCDWGWIHALVGLSDYILHIYIIIFNQH